MLNRAAVQAGSPLDADLGIAAGSLTFWRERCLHWQRHDLDRALASFTFVADVTTLAEDCRFAGDSQTLVARYDGLPFAAIAFYSQHRLYANGGKIDENDDVSKHVAALTRRLVAPDETFICLVAEKDWPLLQAAYQVLEVHPEWQMLFPAGSIVHRPSSVVRPPSLALNPADIPAMSALAQREGMEAFEHDPLSRGPWYGVWDQGELVAQGGTHLLLDQAAEIGNIVTAEAYRRRGYGTRVVAALLRELTMEGRTVFLHVLKANEAAVAFYEHLGFERQRTMILARCCV